MNSSEKLRTVHLAFLSSLAAVIACGSEPGVAGTAGSGGVSAAGAGASGATAAAIGSKASPSATAGRAGSSTRAVNDAGVVSGRTAARSLDASVVDDRDSGAGMGADGSAGASGAGGEQGQANAADGSAGQVSPIATVTLTGQVIEAQANGNFTPYAGAEVCVLDSSPAVCAKSDASGMLVIKLPANALTGLTMEQDGVFPMLTPITTGTSDIDLGARAGWTNYGVAVVISQETRTSSEAMLGTKLDDTKGQADMIVFSLGTGNVSIVGGSAELKWFRNSAGQTTVSDGPAPPLSILHGFTNIEPGMLTFRAENNGRPCRWDPMIWAGDQPGTVTIPIRPGWWTRLMEVQCD